MLFTKSFLFITLAATLASCASYKKTPIREIANIDDEHHRYITYNRNFWSPEQKYSQADLTQLNDKIRHEFSLTKFQTVLKGKAAVTFNQTPRVFNCEVKVLDFSKKAGGEDKMIILMDVRDNDNKLVTEFSRSFSTAEDLKAIKKVGSYPRSSRVVLYRPFGAPNLTTDIKFFKGKFENFINIVTNTPLTFDKSGVTCEF